MIIKFIIIGFGMVVGDFFMKLWSNQGYLLRGTALLFYISAVLIYIASLTYYGKQLHNTNFSIATTLPIIINILFVALITIFYYKEPLSINALIGTVLSLVAVLFFYFT